MNCRLGGAHDVPTNLILSKSSFFSSIPNNYSITAADFSDWFLPLLQKGGMLVKPAVLLLPCL